MITSPTQVASSSKPAIHPPGLPPEANRPPTWPPAPGQEEGLFDHAREVLDVHDQEVVLGDLARDLDNRGLLEGVRADEAAGHLGEQEREVFSKAG